jgi:ELWxxDGT repeat protein
MKNYLFVSLYLVLIGLHANGQGVTQINDNKSLVVDVPLSANKTFLHSNLDSSIWVTDGTPAGTVQISPTIKFEDDWGLLNGKIVFRGSTIATGSELYISDGTPGGTTLVSDINTGSLSSSPTNFALLGSFLYFTAESAATGRELWQTNGTLAGTTLVKDIMPGALSSFNLNSSPGSTLFTNGTYLLFAANTSAGNELWKSDGTTAGTILLKDINTGNSGADSSNPDNFIALNNIVLFTATDATDGNELWKTDGSAAGTVLVKDINPGTGNSTTFDVFPGVQSPVFLGFHIFNNRAYFNANDGVSAGEIWVTDGTKANTTLLKDFPFTAPNFPRPFLFDAINFPGKFIFPYGDLTTRSELWQSDGTSGGTVLFKSFSPTTPGQMPFIFIPYNVDFVNQTLTNPLFNGKFFFAAGTPAQGTELWSSDGTVGGTNLVKDINPGTADGIDFSIGDGSYLYTAQTFFFGASEPTDGGELWRTDGTAGNTAMVANINPNAGNSHPELSFFVANGKVLFGATEGNPVDSSITDLYVVGGTFIALPIKLTDFTVVPQNNDALLQWSTQEELNSKSFVIQRSYDAEHFENIGSVNAKGTTSAISKYSFVDPGIMKSGKTVVYYRLNSLDQDLKSAITNVISLKINGDGKWSLRLLSNPVNDFVSLLASDVSGRLQLSIRDISGKVVYSNSMDNVNGQISLPAPAQSGIYILEAENNNERRILRFIK